MGSPEGQLGSLRDRIYCCLTTIRASSKPDAFYAGGDASARWGTLRLLWEWKVKPLERERQKSV